MPYSYTIDVERRLVTSVFSGVMSTEEMLAHERSLSTDPDFSPDFDQVADFMDVPDVSIQVSDVPRLAAAGPWSRTSRRAGCFGAVHVYGLARMYEVYCDAVGTSFRAFRDRQAAEAWLTNADHAEEVTSG